jgi:putative transposase
LYPTKKQITLLEQWLDECRWLYNKLLEQRKLAYELEKKTLKMYDQINGYGMLKQERESLNLVHSQVLQNVAVRIDLAFKAFFRRIKAGEKPGYPRFRGKYRYDSFTFPQVPSGCSIDGNHLKLSKIGKVKIKQHRKLEGVPKTCTIKRSSTGKWYAVFSCEVEQSAPLPKAKSEVGIDVGLESFAYLSDDTRIENPKFFRQDEKEVAKAQRKLSKEAKGTPARARRRKPVARIHERIQWRRKNFAHQEARKIVNQHGVICVEDLNVNRMLHNHCLAKSISDAAWSLFFQLIQSKAEEAGRIVVKVNPAYTSQTCHQCGHRQKKNLSERWHKCECCGFECHRDLNAALNIKALGLQSLFVTEQEAAPL